MSSIKIGDFPIAMSLDLGMVMGKPLFSISTRIMIIARVMSASFL